MYTSSWSSGNIKDHKYTIEFIIKIYYVGKKSVQKSNEVIYRLYPKYKHERPFTTPYPYENIFPRYSTFQSTAQTSQYYIITHLRLQSTLSHNSMAGILCKHYKNNIK